MAVEPILIDGQWRQARQIGTLRAVNPAHGERLPFEFPISSWADCDAALAAASAAARGLAALPPSVVADFLERYAERLATHAEAICGQAHLETGLPVKPRLAEVEMP